MLQKPNISPIASSYNCGGCTSAQVEGIQEYEYTKLGFLVN